MPYDLISCFPKSRVILDPYFGSGTTGVAANMLKKDWIGIEKARSYCKEAKTRLGLKLSVSELDIKLDNLFSANKEISSDKIGLHVINELLSTIIFLQQVEFIKLFVANGTMSDDGSQFGFHCDEDIANKILAQYDAERNLQEACFNGDTEAVRYWIEQVNDVYIEQIEDAFNNGYNEIVVILTEKFIENIENKRIDDIILVRDKYLNAEQLEKYGPIIAMETLDMG